jgi:RNA polymerase sigma-70 factor (ECF subfamily)
MYSDQQWIANLTGPPDVRDQAIEELRGILLRALAKGLGHYLNGAAYVEDITQEALLKILNSLDSFEGRSRFLTWAMTIATRTGISILRRKHHQDQSLEAFTDDDGYRIEIPDTKQVENSELASEVGEILQMLIDSDLTAKQRMVLRASLDGYSTDGIAQKANMSRNSVYKSLHDSRMKLKSGLLSHGFDETSVLSIIG